MKISGVGLALQAKFVALRRRSPSRGLSTGPVENSIWNNSKVGVDACAAKYEPTGPLTGSLLDAERRLAWGSPYQHHQRGCGQT